MDAAQSAWEGIATDVLGSTGCDDPPVDAFELAECTEHEVRFHMKPGACRSNHVIYVDARARRERQHGLIAHELGHWALVRAREDNTERGARYLAGALLLPRQPFEADLRAMRWDLEQLRARHVNASAELIARRVVNLKDAVASVWDNGKLSYRVWSPWLPERLWGKKASKVEATLAAAALESGQVERSADLFAAWPIFEAGWRRVIVLAEAEQLSLRL